MSEYPQFDGMLLQMAQQLGNAGAGGIEALLDVFSFLVGRQISIPETVVAKPRL